MIKSNEGNGCFKIGDVYLMEFNGNGSEQSGLRPGLIFQNNVGNDNSPNVIALPLTSSLKKMNMPTHVLIKAEGSGLHKDSLVLCENPERMSKSKIGKFLTRLSDEDMRNVAIGSVLASGAIAFLTEAELLNAWKRSVALNQFAA